MSFGRYAKSQHALAIKAKICSLESHLNKRVRTESMASDEILSITLEFQCLASFWQMRSLSGVSANLMPTRSSGVSFHSNFFGMVSMEYVGGGGFDVFPRGGLYDLAYGEREA